MIGWDLACCGTGTFFERASFTLDPTSLTMFENLAIACKQPSAS